MTLLDFQHTILALKFSESGCAIFSTTLQNFATCRTLKLHTISDKDYTLRRLRHCPFSSANSRPLCSPEVILTVLHVLNICAFYYDSRRYFSYIVRCPSSHYWLYATLISALMNECMKVFKLVTNHVIVKPLSQTNNTCRKNTCKYTALIGVLREQTQMLLALLSHNSAPYWKALAQLCKWLPAEWLWMSN